MRELKNQLYEQVARIGKAIASPKRLELIELLCQGEKTVETLATQADISVKLASAHLKELRLARLVDTRKDGKYVVYRLASTSVADLWVTLRTEAEERLVDLQMALASISAPDGVQRGASTARPLGPHRRTQAAPGGGAQGCARGGVLPGPLLPHGQDRHRTAAQEGIPSFPPVRRGGGVARSRTTRCQPVRACVKRWTPGRINRLLVRAPVRATTKPPSISPTATARGPSRRPPCSFANTLLPMQRSPISSAAPVFKRPSQSM